MKHKVLPDSLTIELLDMRLSEVARERDTALAKAAALGAEIEDAHTVLDAQGVATGIENSDFQLAARIGLLVGMLTPKYEITITSGSTATHVIALEVRDKEISDALESVHTLLDSAAIERGHVAYRVNDLINQRDEARKLVYLLAYREILPERAKTIYHAWKRGEV